MHVRGFNFLSFYPMFHSNFMWISATLVNDFHGGFYDSLGQLIQLISSPQKTPPTMPKISLTLAGNEGELDCTAANMQLVRQDLHGQCSTSSVTAGHGQILRPCCGPSCVGFQPIVPPSYSAAKTRGFKPCITPSNLKLYVPHLVNPEHVLNWPKSWTVLLV